MKQLRYNKSSEEIKYLLDKDASLDFLFPLKDEIVVNIDDNYFLSLAGIIVAQQLSSKVANAKII